MKYNIKRDKGFTLIETLVAISIMAIGLAAPLTAVSLAIKSAAIAQDQIGASYLAQEGIEYVRHVRDTNILKGNSWLGHLDFCANGTPCDIEDILVSVSNNSDFINCGALGCSPVKYDGLLYGVPVGDDSKFTREIEVDDINPTEAEIVVTISWTTRNEDRILILRENMFNWSGN